MSAEQPGTSALASRHLLVDGLRLHALVSHRRLPETAPTVVFVHGLIASGRYLAPTAEHLMPEAHVAVPDLPGFGTSEAPDGVFGVVQLADALCRFLAVTGATPTVVVGHSMGCQVAVHAANRHPDRIDKVALVCPAFDPEGGGAWGTAARWARGAIREPLALHRVLAADLARCGLRRGLRTYRLGLADRLEAQLPSLGVPTLVVGGARDPVAPRAWVERVAALTPGAEVAVIPGARHHVNWTHPAELAAVLGDFISRR